MNSEQDTAIQSLLFNYGDIDVDATVYLKQNAEETRGLLKRTSEDMARIGKNLMDAKARLPHGQFIPWVKAELGMSQSTAWRFMQIAQGKSIKKSFTVNDLMEELPAPTPERIPLSLMMEYNNTLLSEPFREFFQVFTHCGPYPFDPLLQAQKARYEYLMSVGKDPETDEIMQMMHEEIHAIVVKGLNREEIQ